MSWPFVHSDVAEPCQLSPPSRSSAFGRVARSCFTSVARCANPPVLPKLRAAAVKSRCVKACASRVPGLMPKCFSSASPTRCGGLPGRVADADVHAGLAEMHRQQLRVDVGEVQQAHAAERRVVVETRAGRQHRAPRATTRAGRRPRRRRGAGGSRGGAWSRRIGSGSRERRRRARRSPATPRDCSRIALLPDPDPIRLTLLIHRRLRIHQQRDDVLDLLLVQDAVVSEARHVRARRVRLRVVDLAPGVLLDLGRKAAQLREVVQRRPDRAVADLGLAELVARVAIRADRRVLRVRPLEAGAALRDLLAALPVAEIACRRPAA